MNIYGEKIVLRAITDTDTDFLLELINDPETEKMLGGSSFPVSKEEQKKWIGRLEMERNILRCVIAEKENVEQGVGSVILSDIDMKNGTAQIHIKMAKEKGRGKGYGTDAVGTIVKYAFHELRLNCVYAEVLSYNVPSQKLFLKCGFHQDGVMRSRVYKDGNYTDVISFSCLKSDCKESVDHK